ncbi:tRNA (cytidine/uridine-2'-O-)-methyltransferase [Lachnospiraceae bacterium NE2001]|nr:tRNA (cytidine/uridine-2'-O-)-methyltransferase [Lachnospiraceae bacterium NE2001]
MINIVLHEPEIPYNTGNIGRTCVITGSRLHLIRPYGFFLNDKMIKRAGLDYWSKLDVKEHDNVEAFYSFVLEDCSESLQSHSEEENSEENHSEENHSEKNRPRIFYATTKAKQKYTDVTYHDGDYIMFGRESAGIPEEILVQHPEDCIRIPMLPEERSLNLSNSAAIILYEALRQMDFLNLESQGDLHRLSW